MRQIVHVGAPAHSGIELFTAPSIGRYLKPAHHTSRRACLSALKSVGASAKISLISSSVWVFRFWCFHRDSFLPLCHEAMRSRLLGSFAAVDDRSSHGARGRCASSVIEQGTERGYSRQLLGRIVLDFIVPLYARCIE